MNNWTKNKINNISNLSKDENFPNLINEWKILDEMNINDNISSICNLCGKKHLKYEYFILNQNNKNKMLIGSDCIFLFFEKVDKLIVEANNEIFILNKSEMRQHLVKILKGYWKEEIIKLILLIK